MSKVKYIISFFLILSSFLFIGESYTYYIENFQDNYVMIHYYLETGDLDSEMNAHIQLQATEFNTNVFALEKIDNGAFDRTIVVYGDEEVGATLKADWNITEGYIRSFFSGTTKILFKDFSHANEKAMSNCYYINTTAEHLYDMVYPNMVQYSGSIQSIGSTSDGTFVVIGVFTIVLAFILLLSLYDIAYNKKEYCIQLLHGSSLNVLIKNKVIKDVIGIILATVLAFILSGVFTVSAFKWEVSVICIIIALFINAIFIIIGMKKINPYQLKSNTGSKILNYSLLFKCLVSIITVIALTSTAGLIIEGIKLYSQKNYYKTQENTVHIDIDYPYDYAKFGDPNETMDPIEQVIDNFIIYSYKYLDCSLVYYTSSYAEIAPKYGNKYIYANLQGVKRYEGFIEEWDEISSQEGNYILVPDNIEVSHVLEEIPTITGVTLDNIEGIITYKAGLSVIAESRIEEEFEYSYEVKNPIIFLDTYDYGNLDNYSVTYSMKKNDEHKGIIYNRSRYLYQFISIKNMEEELSAFSNVLEGEAIKSTLVEISTINISDWFDGLWELRNRSLLISIILTILLLVLDIQTAILVLRMFYETNAKELTIKKVLGYSILERFKSIFLITGVCFACTLIMATMLSFWFSIGIAGYIILTSIGVFILDIIMALLLIKGMDRLQIQKAIKGGI